MASRVVAVAASAGGVEALRKLVADLPSDLDAAICIVLHIPPTGRSLLAPILARDSALDTMVAKQGAPLRRGRIYVAPADWHLLIREDTVQLTRGPKENGVRPAADPMFRTLARTWGPRAIAVVLSGALDDGAAGAAAVVASGGRLVVQHPDDALVPGMPSSALAATRADAIVPIDELGKTLQRLIAEPAEHAALEEAAVSPDPDPVELDPANYRPDGPASGFTCPECNGAIWEVREGELVRFRCRVGHAYSAEAMAEAQGAAVEAALWAALEVLEERGELLRRIASRMERLPASHHRFREGAREADERAAVIRRVLAMSAEGPGHAPADEESEAG